VGELTMAFGKRPIGAIQRHVLWSMISYGRPGVWFPGCGWYFETKSRTMRIMESLRLKGLVEFTGSQYVITEAGRDAAGDPSTIPPRR
jgi:hypothetical protein